MIRKIIKLFRNIITAFFVLYGLNIILSSLNIIIPINFITVGIVSLLGIPSIFLLVLLYFVIR